MSCGQMITLHSQHDDQAVTEALACRGDAGSCFSLGRTKDLAAILNTDTGSTILNMANIFLF